VDLNLTPAELKKIVRSFRPRSPGDVSACLQEVLLGVHALAVKEKLKESHDRNHFLNYVRKATAGKLTDQARRAKRERNAIILLGERAELEMLRPRDKISGTTSTSVLEEFALDFLRCPTHELKKLFPSLDRDFVEKLGKHYNRQPEALTRDLDRQCAIVLVFLHLSERIGRTISGSLFFGLLQGLTKEWNFEEAISFLVTPLGSDVGREWDPDIRNVYRAFEALREGFTDDVRELIEDIGARTTGREWRKRAFQRMVNAGERKGRNAPERRRG